MFVSIRSANFVWCSFWSNVYFSLQFQKIRLKFKNSVFKQKFVRYKKTLRSKFIYFKWGPHILTRTFFDKMYILCFGFKKTLLKIKNSIFQPKYMRYKISIKIKNCFLENSLRILYTEMYTENRASCASVKVRVFSFEIKKFRYFVKI